MNVLITGHTGFIGSYLWKAVENKNYATKISGFSTNECFEALDLIGDQGFDSVYHLAASLNEDLTEHSLFRNPLLTMRLLNMYKEWYGKSFIHTSTVSIELKIPTFYSLSKKIVEDICSFYVHKYDINVCSIRLPSVYGPGMKSKTVIDKFIRAALKDEDIILYNKGEREQFFGYVKDVAAVLELAGRENLRGVFSYPCNSISMKLLAETIIEILNSNSTIKYIDGNEDVLEAFYHNFLSFKQPYGLEAGIKDYAKWIKEENNKC